jgi:hypothetical protein
MKFALRPARHFHLNFPSLINFYALNTQNSSYILFGRTILAFGRIFVKLELRINTFIWNKKSIYNYSFMTLKKALGTLLVCLLIFAGNSINAQNITIEGTLIDSTIREPLNSATVSLAHASDSSLISFTRTNEQGFFQLKNVTRGKYLLSVSYTGYAPLWLAFKLSATDKLLLGNIYMTAKNQLANVVIEGRRPPVVINNDTIEFNSENFKTVPNAVVEDMLKKMPGIEIDKTGAITVNGKSVSKVYVNGKEFFTGDPKMATRNLPADAVDKIQVYDRKSDQASFTGIDDGNEQTSINIKLKKDRNHTTFGKLTAAAGDPGRWDGQGNMNRLNNDEQISLIGMANNTNRQGFSFGDIANFSGAGGGMRPGGGGGMMLAGGADASGLPVSGGGSSNQGVATTFAGGANYSNNFNKKSSDFNANITGSDIDRNIITNSYIQNLAPNNLFNQFTNTNSHTKDVQAKFGSTLDQKITDKFSFKFVPSITSQHSTSGSTSNIQTFLPDGTLANISQSNTTGVTDALNASGSLLLRKSFARKGRTLSSTITMGYNNSNGDNNQFSDLQSYVGGALFKDSTIKQHNIRKGITSSYSANLVYTEPIGKKSLLEFNTFLSESIGSSSKKVYDFNTNGNKYDIYNNQLSNEYKSDYVYSGGGMNFRSNQKKMIFSTGFSLQNASLKGRNITTDLKLGQQYLDILPAAMVQYNFSRTKNLNFNYRTSTSQPSLTQLQPVLDLSNINNLYIGNPDLKRSYTHNFNLRYFSSKFISQKNFFVFLNAAFTNHSIVNYDSILVNHTLLTKPVNVNGVYRINGNANYGFGLKQIHSRINLGLNAGLNNNVSYANSVLNTIVVKSLGPSISYNYQLDEKIDLDLSARYSYSFTNNKINPSLNTNYLTKVYRADVTNYLPWSLVLNQSLNYTINSGLAQGYNTAIPIWNASLSKLFLKNKRAEIKLSAYDLLKKGAGVGRTVSQSQIVDQQYNVISRYLLIGFTYSLQKSGLTTGNGPPRPPMMRMD